MYDCPRNATVAATVDAVVWVMDRAVFRWGLLAGSVRYSRNWWTCAFIGHAMPCRYFVREQQETAVSQVELFLNSVPILASLSRDERLRLVDALEEVVFTQGSKVNLCHPKIPHKVDSDSRSMLNIFQVITEGDKGDLFYIIKDGEAVVLQNTNQGQRKVNHLFKADFFGERALLCDEPR